MHTLTDPFSLSHKLRKSNLDESEIPRFTHQVAKIKRVISHCVGEGAGKQAPWYMAGRRANLYNFFMDSNWTILVSP